MVRIFALFLSLVVAGCATTGGLPQLPSIQAPGLSAPSELSSANRPQQRQVVRVDVPDNTIYIDTSSRFLYLSLGNGQAMRYAIGVARDGFHWNATVKVARKAEWPDWHPPAEMRERELKQRRRILPVQMAGGPDNPLGARALYLHRMDGKDSLYRIHGTNEPWTIGQAVSSGCIRMINDDVIDLYNRVEIGMLVIVR